MTFYELNFACLVLANAYLFYKQHQQDKFTESTKHVDVGAKSDHSEDAVPRFKKEFFSVYLLAFAADWLQGPHIYALYKYEKGFAETMVAALYATGFISGAVSASFVGQLADKYGRRAACLVYCLAYGICCLTMLSNNLPILFFGRACGGLSTTLLYSVFETWMMTEYHSRELDVAGLSLSNVFGRMTTLSSIVAIVSGVFGEFLVKSTGTRTAPFVASIVCLTVAADLIWRNWNENYGNAMTTQEPSTSERAETHAVLRDKRILSVGITSCFFEGAMYLFIFFWSAALKSAQTHTGTKADPPFGLIFSCFMCSMMSGSIVFTLWTPSHDLTSASLTLKMAVSMASCCLLSTVLLKNEMLIFWAFCVLEACIGAYFPSMAFVKGRVVEDGVRGKVYGILRLPLNVFVVVAHSLAEEGDHHRDNVFLTCGGLLLVAFLVLQRYLNE